MTCSALPALVAPEETRNRPELFREYRPGPPRKSVLTIEDNPEYASVLRLVLTRGGAFRLETAGSLYEGLNAIACRPPDAILIDLDLPDSSGYITFLHVCRAAPHACLLVLTASNDDQMAVRAIEDGAQDYLVKEVTDLRTLPRRIQLAFERQKRNGSKTPELS